MRHIPVWAALATAALVTTSCSLVGGDDDSGDDSKRVVLVTHESFVISEELQKQFEDESGYDLVVKASGDAGALTNKLVLTKDDPTGDAVRGVDVGRDVQSWRRTPPRCRTARTSTRWRATTTTTSPRSTPATSASTSTTPGSRTTASRSRRPSTTW